MINLSIFDWLWDFFSKLAVGVSAEMLANLSAAIPKITAALLVVLIGLLIARSLRVLLRRVLAGVGIDRFAERLNDIDLVQRSGMQIRLSVLIAQTLYYMIMLVVTVAATDVLGIQAITDLVRDLLNYLPALFTAGVVFLLGLFLADMVKNVVHTACRSLGIPSAGLISSAVFYFLFITVVVSALAQAKINTEFIASNLTVIIGAGALAFAFGYGLAARDLVANYLAGHYNRNKVRVGDDVRVAGVRGKVVLIDATSLVLQTTDRAIIVPLSKLTTEKIEIFYPDGQDENLLEPGK